MPNKIFFTADSHFGHKNIIKYSNRPYSNVEEMNEDLIQKWNSVVRPNDYVYHLGDIFICPKTAAEPIRKRLNGMIHFIEGNHDSTAEQMKSTFASYRKYHEFKVADKDAGDGYQHITLCHYAGRVWNKSHHGAWMLYGHSHQTLPREPGKYSFDVGVDCWDGYPISYEQVKWEMKCIKEQFEKSQEI